MRRSVPLLLLTATLTLSCRSGTERDERKPLPTVQAELQMLRQAGIPTTAEALQDPLPPPDRNAASLYVQLDALLKSKPLTGDDKIVIEITGRSPLTADKANKLRAALRRRSDIARLVRQVIERPECVFTRQWSLGTELTFPEYPRMRTAARWICAESALLLYDGKPLEAIHKQAEGFHISRHVAKNSALISCLLQGAIDAINLAGMERVLYAAGGKPEIAMAVRTTVQKEWREMSLAHSLHAEVYIVLSEIEKLRHVGPKSYDEAVSEFAKEDRKALWPSLSSDERQNWNGFIDRTEAAIISNQKRIIDAADLPYSQASPAFQRILADVNAQDKDATFVYARRLIPVYVPQLSRRTGIAAKAATVRAGAALLEWKARHGQFPSSLAEAMPSVPSDPFDDRPLRYAKEGSGFRLYSVGPSGKFDGGKPDVKPASMETVFRYPKPAWLK